MIALYQSLRDLIYKSLFYWAYFYFIRFSLGGYYDQKDGKKFTFCRNIEFIVLLLLLFENVVIVLLRHFGMRNAVHCTALEKALLCERCLYTGS